MRCFVACWPDDATRSRLDDVARAAFGRNPLARRVRPENLHLTLAFIGELPQSMACEVCRAMAELTITPFTWCIDRLGRFDRANIVWAGGADESRLSELADRVRTGLRALEVRFDRKPFAAHVTLLRDLPAPRGALEPGQAIESIEPIEPIGWPIGAARLLASERDADGLVRYRLVEPD